MTLKERISNDGVGMRWLRTAATTISALTAALVVIWGVVLWLIEPRVIEWAETLVDGATTDLSDGVTRNTVHLDKLDVIVERLEMAIDQLSKMSRSNSAPVWRWSVPDTSISDGEIGGRVRINAAGYKLRDCGAPTVDLYFVNGGGSYHRFVEASILSADNRGISLPVDLERIQKLSYTAVIPKDDNVSAGRAMGYISVVYRDCPSAPDSVVGPLQFRIIK